MPTGDFICRHKIWWANCGICRAEQELGVPFKEEFYENEEANYFGVTIIGDTIKMDRNFDDLKNDEIVQKMEKEYPQMCEEFKSICVDQYKLFLYKQHDYGPGNIAMGTALSNKDEVKLSITALIIRLNDKVNRLINLVIKKNEEPANEPIVDAFKDISVYGIIAQLVKNNKWAK